MSYLLGPLFANPLAFPIPSLISRFVLEIADYLFPLISSASGKMSAPLPYFPLQT